MSSNCLPHSAAPPDSPLIHCVVNKDLPWLLKHYQPGAIFDNLNLPHLPYFHARGWPARAMPSLTAEFLCPILALPLSVSSLFAYCSPSVARTGRNRLPHCHRPDLSGCCMSTR